MLNSLSGGRIPLVRHRLERIADLIEQIEQHPMCFKFETRPDYFVVIYPGGEFMHGGAAANHMVLGKIEALKALWVYIENEWRRSYPSPFQPQLTEYPE